MLAATTAPDYMDHLSDDALIRDYATIRWAAEHYPDPLQREWAATVLGFLQAEHDRRGRERTFLPTRAATSKVKPARETFPAHKTDFDADEIEEYGARLHLPLGAIPRPSAVIAAAPALVPGVSPPSAPPPAAPIPTAPEVEPEFPTWSKPPPVTSTPTQAPVEEPTPPISPGAAGLLAGATILLASPDAGAYSDVLPETEEERRRRRRGCFAPSLAYHEPVPQGWGATAEYAIEEDYCATFGCGATDWFDRLNPLDMVAFLTRNNPNVLGPRKAAALRAQAGSLRRPDVLSHKARRKEYYEIKPDSRSGRRAGRDKLLQIALFMAGYGLPYEPGTSYTPVFVPIPPITPGPIIGRPLGYDYLLVRLAEPGLIVYKVCDSSRLEAD